MQWPELIIITIYFCQYSEEKNYIYGYMKAFWNDNWIEMISYE